MGHVNDGSAQVQVETRHYRPSHYLTPQRMASIGWQLRLATRYFTVGTLLEVGVGARLPRQLFMEEGWQVTGLDIDPALRPDLVASVARIPCADRSFDTFLCCQVLEHMPWEQSVQAIGELYRVCRSGGIISVPTRARAVAIVSYTPRKEKVRMIPGLNLCKAKMLTPKEHSWELEAGVKTRQFRRALTDAGFTIVRALRPVAQMYHQFYVVTRQ